MKAILEKTKPLDRSRSFLCFEFEIPRFRNPFHFHPEIELTLIVNSTGQRYVGDHIGRFAADDLVLIGANLPHTYMNDEKFKGPASAVVVQFLPTFLGTDFLEAGEMTAIRRLLDRSRLGLAFFGETRTRVAMRMLRLAQLQGFERLKTLLEILHTLATSSDCRQLARAGYSPSLALFHGERINSVCELISRKFREGITQSEAARTAKMSPASFSRFFRRATNRTFRAFLNEVRIGHASHLLAATERTIAEICYDSGFGNLSNFNRQFLKLRKTSPKLYRRDRWRRENAYFERKDKSDWTDMLFPGQRRLMGREED